MERERTLSATEIVRVALAMLSCGDAPISIANLPANSGCRRRRCLAIFPTVDRSTRRSPTRSSRRSSKRMRRGMDGTAAFADSRSAASPHRCRNRLSFSSESGQRAGYAVDECDSASAARCRLHTVRCRSALPAIILYVNPAFFVGEEGRRRGEAMRGTSPLLRSPDTRARFPALSAVVDDLAELSYEDQYILGADRLIAGLAADLEQS